MKRGILYLVLSSLFISANAASAGDLTDALLAYSVLDYGSAFPPLLSLAQEGTRDAQTRVGIMYLHGEGVPVDLREAVKWLRSAGEAGSSEAYLELAEALKQLGNPNDYQEALYWLSEAAKRNVGEANALIGEMHLFGQGTNQSYVEALSWFQRGADSYDPKAFLYLGLCYASGLGVARDDIEAMKWFQLAWRTSPLGATPPEISAAYQAQREHLMPGEVSKADEEVESWIKVHRPG
jgi:TPR repeat protein